MPIKNIQNMTIPCFEEIHLTKESKKFQKCHIPHCDTKRKHCEATNVQRSTPMRGD